MGKRGLWRLLSSCFPLVLAFLAAALLAAPAGPPHAVEADGRAVASAPSQSGPAASAYLDADEPAAVPGPASPVRRTVIVVLAPRPLLDSGSRKPAAPRGPPHLFA
jgi:hypothetical protein